MSVETEISNTIQKLPTEVQADLLALAKDWTRAYPPPTAGSYEENVTKLLQQRAKEANENPERLISADALMDELTKKWAK